MPIGTLPDPTKGVVPVPRRPPGAVVVGDTGGPDPQPIYEMEFEEVARRPDGAPIKDPVLGPDGAPMWAKHPGNGEPLYPKLRVRRIRRVRRFTLNIERNERGVGTGRVSYNFNYEPDPAEKARTERAAKVRGFQQELAERAVERGLTVDELLSRALAPDAEDVPAPGFADPVETRDRASATGDLSDYPKMKGPKRWALTPTHEAQWEAGDLKLFTGTKAEAQAKLAEMLGAAE